MRHLLLLVYLLMGCEIFLASSVNNPALIHRIIGGSNATDGQFPYQAFLTDHYQYCGGCIITERWVVTAAHCVRAMSQTAWIHVGSIYIFEGKSYEVLRYVSHENFNTTSKANDIGLVETKRNIEFTVNVQPLKIANKPFSYTTVLTVTGWGYISYDTTLKYGESPRILQYVNVDLYLPEDCIKRWKFINPNTTICTLSGVGTGTCRGDSGGPLVANGTELVGIVSFGKACAVGSPDVYTNVAGFYSWIEESTQECL